MHDSKDRDAIGQHLANELSDGGWHHFTDLTRVVAGAMPANTPEPLMHNEIVRRVSAGELVRIGAMIRSRAVAQPGVQNA